MDAHLHRITHLSDAIPLSNAINIKASVLFAAFLATQLENPLLIGPDSESRQWVSSVARQQHYDFAIAKKCRQGDRNVSVSLPDTDMRDRDVVILDDIISTGHTIMQTARVLKEKHVGRIYCLVTHALCGRETIRQLQENGIQELWSTDSIPHETNRLNLDKLLAETIKNSLPFYA